MAFVIIVTMVLEVLMAFRIGRGRNALICLIIGIVVPVLLVLVR